MADYRNGMKAVVVVAAMVVADAVVCQAGYFVDLPRYANPGVPVSALSVADYGRQANPVAISPDGLTVVGYDYHAMEYLDPVTGYHTVSDPKAWLYRHGPSPVTEVLGNFYAPGSSSSTTYMGVANDPLYVVGRGTDVYGNKALRYYPQSGFNSILLPVPGNTNVASSFAINATGSVVVGQVQYQGSSQWRGVRWDNGVMSELPGQYESGPDCTPVAVSQDGSVIAGNTSSGWAFVIKNGVMNSISESGASIRGLSGDGSIVVGQNGLSQASLFQWGQIYYGGRYYPAYVSASLGFAGVATGSSFDGSTIVGTDKSNTLQYRAFVYDRLQGTKSDLNTLAGALVPSGWTLSEATGVSADGRTIVGRATVGNETHAFMLRLDRQATSVVPANVTTAIVLPSSRLSVDVTAAGSGSLTVNQIAPDELDGSASALWQPGMGAGVYPQMWKLEGTGFGQTTLVFHYDEQAILTAGISENDLMIYHFTGGQWVPGGVVDPAANTVTLSVTDFSPFSLGVAVPEPASLSLVGAAGLLLGRRRSRVG